MKVSVIIPTLRKNQAYLDLCVRSLLQNTRAFEIELFIALNGQGTVYPQGQCRATNREAQFAAGEWILVTNDDMYYAPGWDCHIDFSKSLCWCPNLIEPVEQHSAAPFLKCDAGFTLDQFNSKRVDDFVHAMRDKAQAWETGFNFPIFVHKELWDVVGGYDPEYDPWGSNSDSDLQTKFELAGVKPHRNRGCLVYHFSNKSGTFDGSHEAERGRNFEYYKKKWGFPRADNRSMCYSVNIIDYGKLAFKPDWASAFATRLPGNVPPELGKRCATILSGCTVVRNGVKLNYPLEASLLSYLPLCDEVVICYDPTSEDETEKQILDLARQYPKIRPLPSPWDMGNHAGGTEIAIQSNVAIEACRGEWILYVQADEAIHEGDHDAIRQALDRKDLCGVLFDRKSFLFSLDREIPEYQAGKLLRLFRNGLACAVGDAMSCGLVQGAKGEIMDAGWRLYNYSRMGKREEILSRCRSLHGFYHETKDAIDQNLARELNQQVCPYDPDAHPLPIRKYYKCYTPSVSSPHGRKPALAFPVDVVVLLGPHEHENVVPFLQQFRDWPGGIIVIDDTPDSGEVAFFRRAASQHLGSAEVRLRVIQHPHHGDFAAARNRAHDVVGAEWVLHADLDERWDAKMLHDIPRLIAQLERDEKLICGFPRANLIEGVLVNDVSDSEWTEDGLKRAARNASWPPRNRDVQYRLVRKNVRWEGTIHEKPESLSRSAERVVEVRDHWILHVKSLDRQRRQDGLYRSLGQQCGMPQEETVCIPDGIPLREAVLTEAVRRLPPGRLIAVETGTLRDPSPQARFGDGWSTLHLAKLLAERKDPSSCLYSIDIDPRYIEISKKAVPGELHAWIIWICSDSREALAKLEADRIDLLYLDSSDDPDLTFAEFRMAQAKIVQHSLVVVDDTGSYAAGPQGKGSRIIPELITNGWRVEHRRQGSARMTILSRGCQST